MDCQTNTMYSVHYMLYLIAVAVFTATILGGSLALILKDRLHLILGFSAGAVIAVAFFGILPEAIKLGGDTYSASTILSITAFGFMLYLLLDRMFLLHNHDDNKNTIHNNRGVAGAGSLSFHSFLDGIGIGFAFQVSATVGAIVTIGVLAHDFSDGINTVNLILKNNGTVAKARKWLLIDATTPVIGIALTFLLTISSSILSLLLALFAGFFLYIGASDLIPESYHAHPVRWTTYSTILGVVILYLVVKFASV